MTNKIIKKNRKERLRYRMDKTPQKHKLRKKVMQRKVLYVYVRKCLRVINSGS